MASNIPLQRFNKRQVRNYIQENNCLIDLSLNSQTPHNLLFVFNKTYQCINKRILAVSGDGTGNLYDSISDWQAEVNGSIKLNELAPVHILYHQIPSRDKFIQEIPNFISNLAQELEIELTELNKTLESLLIIDRVFENHNRHRQISNNKKVLGSLIAYIGEVVKAAINGKWLIQQGDETQWEPIIISSGGKTTSFCILIFDELYEAEEISFYDLAAMLIEPHQQ